VLVVKCPYFVTPKSLVQSVAGILEVPISIPAVSARYPDCNFGSFP
jgi:hypothetical protein